MSPGARSSRPRTAYPWLPYYVRCVCVCVREREIQIQINGRVTAINRPFWQGKNKLPNRPAVPIQSDSTHLIFFLSSRSPPPRERGCSWACAGNMCIVSQATPFNLRTRLKGVACGTNNTCRRGWHSGSWFWTTPHGTRRGLNKGHEPELLRERFLRRRALALLIRLRGVNNWMRSAK